MRQTLYDAVASVHVLMLVLPLLLLSLCLLYVWRALALLLRSWWMLL